MKTKVSAPPLTTFIIPSVGRETLKRAIESCGDVPYLCMYDADKLGPAVCRNMLIKQAKTPWVSFLDDDDILLPSYVDMLRLELERHPEADVVHFREYFEHGQVLPVIPEVVWSNCGIAFSVKREVALEHPFQSEQYEDLHFLERIEEAGYNIHFSKYLTYLARPSW